MALFNFSKRTQAFEDFDENITPEELFKRLKLIYPYVTDLENNVIYIDYLDIEIWHEKGRVFIFVKKFQLPDFMQDASDYDIIKLCNEINGGNLMTCYFYKTDDQIRVLVFRYTSFFIRNIAEINKIVISLAQHIDFILNDIEKNFGKNENN